MRIATATPSSRRSSVARMARCGSAPARSTAPSSDAGRRPHHRGPRASGARPGRREAALLPHHAVWPHGGAGPKRAGCKTSSSSLAPAASRRGAPDHAALPRAAPPLPRIVSSRIRRRNVRGVRARSQGARRVRVGARSPTHLVRRQRPGAPRHRAPGSSLRVAILEPHAWLHHHGDRCLRPRHRRHYRVVHSGRSHPASSRCRFLRARSAGQAMGKPVEPRILDAWNCRRRTFWTGSGRQRCSNASKPWRHRARA